MALSRVTTWSAGNILTAAALNGEFNNILNNPITLISPYTSNVDANLKQTTNFGLEKLAAVATAATAGRLYYRTDNNLPEYDTGTAIRTLPNFLYAGGRLTLSGATLLWSPYYHNLLPINGRLEVIPDAGVTLAIGAAVAATLYYIYAYMSGATMTLEFSATAYASQAGTGVPIKSGDATRTLVGMAYTTAAPAWADTAAQRFTVSYWNRRALGGINFFTTARSTASTSFAELSTEIRVEFLLWANEALWTSAAGGADLTLTTDRLTTAIGFDGTVNENYTAMISGSTAANSIPIATGQQRSGLAEGYHYLTLFGKVSAGTGTWVGSAVANSAARCSLSAYFRG